MTLAFELFTYKLCLEKDCGRNMISISIKCFQLYLLGFHMGLQAWAWGGGGGGGQGGRGPSGFSNMVQIL